MRGILIFVVEPGDAHGSLSLVHPFLVLQVWWLERNFFFVEPGAPVLSAAGVVVGKEFFFC